MSIGDAAHEIYRQIDDLIAGLAQSTARSAGDLAAERTEMIELLSHLQRRLRDIARMAQDTSPETRRTWSFPD
jgi:hypothetical protein